ncbi:hypothetical protein ZHAS_00002798 [Anopheles sinensis]|uniref:Uncharacterized protein n=1 Tax=Anopheles sinensis TaxID=74873 RepID=A0A084VD16_ANOSI|nr:hypothetical protein ZHAS_00002798 [Anopheles sinensis]
MDAAFQICLDADRGGGRVHERAGVGVRAQTAVAVAFNIIFSPNAAPSSAEHSMVVASCGAKWRRKARPACNATM